MKSLLTYLFILAQLILYSQDYLYELNSYEDFKALESVPLSYKYGNTGAVKVIYDIKSDKIYFSNSRYYKFHNDFCTAYLGFNKTIDYFNEHNYKESSERQYYLATINHYRDADIFTFEFSSSDILSHKNIDFFNKVKELLFCKDEIVLFPVAVTQQDFFIKFDASIKFITADYLYENLEFQVLNSSVSYGNLHFIDIDTFNSQSVHKNDIVVINGTPNEMPFCRGIITTDFQAPLSHIVILSHNRKTPIMALKSAWTDKKLKDLNGKLVKLEVGQNFYTLSAAKDRPAYVYWSSRDFKRIKKLKLDIETKGIQDIGSLSHKSVNLVGGKAANFGELNKTYIDINTKLEIPEASFAIPFFYYQQHIVENKLDSLILNIQKEDVKENPSLLYDKLKELRKAIKKSPINIQFLEEVKTTIKKNGVLRLRFRSSTNAEDIAGFNGAGLYDSKTGILDDENKSIEKAIKKVWSSLWNLRAFQEREFFKIDQNTVSMGILVHESFPDEAINGVCITNNIYRPEMNGIVINIQKGEVSIVNPPQSITSELFIVKHNINSKEDIEIENISYSSLNHNKALLSELEIEKLYKILFALKVHFYALENQILRPEFNDYALDVEFKIEKETRKIIVKQARVY